MAACRYGISLLVSHSKSPAFAAFSREVSSSTLEVKYAHPCIILYIFFTSYVYIANSQSGQLSVGRVMHRYRRGHGFESRSGLNFFSGFNFTTALVVCITAAMTNHIFTGYF